MEIDVIPYYPEGLQGWCDLSKAQARFKLSGPDRVRYLDGQVTNRIDQDLSQKSISACLCNVKGKVEALVWITESDDGGSLFIDTEIGIRDQVGERLDRYLIADDCQLEDVTDKTELWHYIGANGAETPEIESIRNRKSNRIGQGGYDYWVESPGQANQPFDDLARISSLELEDWEWAGFCAGVRNLGFEQGAEGLPSELGLDAWTVDFHKGCYLGQEVISRIESVGKTKKQLFLAEFKEIDSFDEVANAESLSKLIILGKTKKKSKKNWISSCLANTEKMKVQPIDSELVMGLWMPFSHSGFLNFDRQN